MHLEWLIVNGGGSPLARRSRHEASLRLMGGGGGGGGRRGRRGGGRRGKEGFVTLSSHKVPDENGISTTDDSAAIPR